MPRVLIVDDAIIMRMKIKLTLEEVGYEVVGEAENGLDGVAQFVKLRPDLVTLDITMPVLSGIKALKEIKRIDKDARVLMLSAMGQEVFVKEAMLAGAKMFIVKPFSKEKLIETVEKLMRA